MRRTASGLTPVIKKPANAGFFATVPTSLKEPWDQYRRIFKVGLIIGVVTPASCRCFAQKRYATDPC